MNVQASQNAAQSSVNKLNQATVTNNQITAIRNQQKIEIQAKGNELKEAEDKGVSLEDLQDQVDGMNKVLEANFTSLKFNVHEQLERIYVQVIDRKTDEVVREIPQEKFLDMMASMLEFVGLLIDKKV